MAIVGGQLLRVARKHGSARRPPLLIFNGIGANLELAFPFMRALEDSEAVIFDVPGVGGSPAPRGPLSAFDDGAARARPGSEAQSRPAPRRRWRVLGRRTGATVRSPVSADVPSTGPHRHGAGSGDAPRQSIRDSQNGESAPLFRPRPHAESIAADLYGGAFRKDPTLIGRHAEAMKGATRYGYFLQLAAMTGWTSIHWLHTLKQQTLILAGADDPLVPAFNARVLARLIPNSRSGADRRRPPLYCQSDPEGTARIVEEFLSRDDL